MLKIGLISDTHGLLRPSALAALRGCDQILHAGDIGKGDILQQLQALVGPDQFQAVLGNNDAALDFPGIPQHCHLQLGAFNCLLVHELLHAPPLLKSEPADIVIFGHSHKPNDSSKDGIRYINPGAAGKRRFSLPITVAILQIEGQNAELKFIDLLAMEDGK